MTGFAVTDTDFGIAAVVVVVVAVLVYRLFRREPQDRLVRFGVFIERKHAGEDGEEVTEKREWPAAKP